VLTAHFLSPSLSSPPVQEVPRGQIYSSRRRCFLFVSTSSPSAISPPHPFPISLALNLLPSSSLSFPLSELEADLPTTFDLEILIQPSTSSSQPKDPTVGSAKLRISSSRLWCVRLNLAFDLSSPSTFADFALRFLSIFIFAVRNQQRC